jgi:hypothetical protein
MASSFERRLPYRQAARIFFGSRLAARGSRLAFV